MRILIVEDNQKLARSIKKGLEQEGYAVDHVADGRMANQRILANNCDYDLVVLDLMLPQLDGLYLCDVWRRANILLPVIMLTAKDTTDDKILGLNTGADDYLIKPFSFEELLARIRALLRRPPELVAPVLSVKDLTLNTSAREATRGGDKIELTLKEFAILEYLMRNAGQVLTREQIISRVWDFSFDSFSNLVDVHMKNLRKKIDGEYDEELLETIRGVGYRIKN
jgi:DNA-binding response OmpR family regulator